MKTSLQCEARVRHTHTHKHTHTNPHTHTHTHTLTHSLIHKHARTHTHTNLCIHTWLPICTILKSTIVVQIKARPFIYTYSQFNFDYVWFTHVRSNVLTIWNLQFLFQIYNLFFQNTNCVLAISWIQIVNLKSLIYLIMCM